MDIGIILFIGVIFGLICAAVASSKGRSVGGWFLLGFLFGWIPLIIVCCVSNLKEEQSYRSHQSRENRRLREQLRQEQMKAEAFRQHAYTRLDAHDRQLGVDTRQTYQALPGESGSGGGLLEDLDTPLDELAQANTQSQMVPPPVQPAPRQWHYRMNGQTVGPIPEPRLLSMLQTGQINAETLVWTEDLGDWKTAGQIKALRAYLSA